MLSGEAYTGLEVPRSNLDISPIVVENDRAEILWDFQMQTHKEVMVNLLDIVVLDKVDKKAVVTDMTTPNDSNIRKKNRRNWRNTRIREQQECKWGLRTVVPVVVVSISLLSSLLDSR